MRASSAPCSTSRPTGSPWRRRRGPGSRCCARPSPGGSPSPGESVAEQNWHDEGHDGVAEAADWHDPSEHDDDDDHDDRAEHERRARMTHDDGTNGAARGRREPTEAPDRGADDEALTRRQPGRSPWPSPIILLAADARGRLVTRSSVSTWPVVRRSSTSRPTPSRSGEMNTTINIIRNRVDAAGVSGANGQLPGGQHRRPAARV